MIRIAFLFPGQGSQQVTMGRLFYEQNQEAHTYYERANQLLDFRITDLMFEGPKERLTETLYSQLAIYVNSFAIFRALSTSYPDITPVYVAGLSLGEYTALAASQRISFEQGLRLVRRRALLMEEACQRFPGTMAAFIGASADKVRGVLEEVALPNQVWIANYNTPTQTVISGTYEGVEACMQKAKQRGMKAILLKVQGAFHSGLMKEAQELFSSVLQDVTLQESTIPMIMNATGGAVHDGSLIKYYLHRQITESVYWVQSIQSMDVDLFLEIGQGQVLAGLNQKIGGLPPTISIGVPQDLEVLQIYLKESHGVISK